MSRPAMSVTAPAACLLLPGRFLMLQLRLWRRWRHVFDLFVANSRSVAVWLKASGIDRVEIIPNGIVARGPRLPLADPPTIVFAGRLAREKGVDTL